MTLKDIKKLINDMTLEEKIGQLIQLPPFFFSDDGAMTGPAQEMGISEEQIFECGSTLSVVGAEAIRAIQDKALKLQPHHIPMLFMADVINGYRTGYPIPLAQGCSFDPELSGECAKMAAREASYDGLDVTFSPMVDLVRDSRWGRVMESTGEDTYLNSCFASAMVEGYQGKDMKEEGSIASCVKHFAAYGAPTAGREYNIVNIDKRTLTDDYLPPYEAAVKAGCAMAMTSFNTIDRIPVTGNKWILRDVLRKKMGFKGVLISDWAAIEELINHGVAKDSREASELAIKAGVDIDMCTGMYFSGLKTLVEEGAISEELIDEALLRILKLKNRLGLFENPYRFLDEDKAKKEILCDTNRKLAKKAAENSMVLLKNDKGILPLKKKGKKIAFIGPYADNSHIFGFWSLWCKMEETPSVKQAIEAGDYSKDVVFAKGCNILDKKAILPGFGAALDNEYSGDNDDLLLEAVSCAKKADIVVLLLGEHAAMSGEGGSRADIRLPKCQRKLFREISKVNSNIVTVLFSGRPLELDGIEKKSRALLEAWFPGTEGAKALLDILYGNVNPSAKLSMSFPRHVGQLPISYDDFPTGRPNDGNPGNRGTTRYQDVENTPLYPFGYGLSYSKYEYGPVILSKKKMTRSDTITASVEVKNISERDGTEVVQLYIRDMKGSVVRPVKKLKGFKKVKIGAGKKKKITFEINDEMLNFTTLSGRFESEAGDFKVYIGPDSQTENCADFVLI